MSAVRLPSRPVPAPLQVQQAEGFSKRRLFEMLSPLEEQSRIIMQGARKRLAADKGEAAGQPWNENFMLSGDSAPGATNRLYWQCKPAVERAARQKPSNMLPGVPRPSPSRSVPPVLLSFGAALE